MWKSILEIAWMVLVFFCLLWNIVSVGRLCFVKYRYNGRLIIKTDATSALHGRAQLQRTREKLAVGSWLFTPNTVCITLWCARSLLALPPVRQFFFTDLCQIHTGHLPANLHASTGDWSCSVPRYMLRAAALPWNGKVFMPARNMNMDFGLKK